MTVCPLCLGKNSSPFSETGGKSYLRCGDCGLTFLFPEHRLDPESERSRYLLHENHPDDPEYRNFLNRLAEPLVKKLPRGAAGLDYGSGPGPTLSVMLKEQGFPMSDYDPFFAPDPNALEGPYDFITCTETIEHFYYPGSELEKLNRMLKPGAWLAVMTEMLDSDDKFPDWHYHREPTHVCFFNKKTMDWIGEHLGWAVEYPGKNVSFFQKRPSRQSREHGHNPLQNPQGVLSK